MALEVMPAPYQLAAAVSREVVLPGANGLLMAGGLTPSGTSVNTVTWLDPVTGATRVAGHLAAATHDAAGFTIAGRAFVAGGGTAASVPTIQMFTLGTASSPGGRATVAGSLARARSDSTGVTVGRSPTCSEATTAPPWTRRCSRPPTGCASGWRRGCRCRCGTPGCPRPAGMIWVFGGQTAGGATDAIQRINPATGAAAVVGHLPEPVQGAAAISLDGRIYVAGGVTAGRASRMVFRFDPATSRVSAVGELPVPVGYAAAGVTGGIGYLIGGEDGSRLVPTVTTFRLVPTGQALPNEAASPWLAPAAGPGRLAPGSDPSVLPADVLIADHHNNRLLIIDPQGRIRWQFPRPGDLAPGQTFLQPDDAFFSPDGQYIVVTQEDDQVISVISLAASTIIYRYGVPGVPGAGPDHLFNPDDAMLTPAGRDRLGRHQELPDRDHHAARAHPDPGHRPDHERLRTRPAAPVRQPERRVPDDQRALPDHRDQRRLGR